MSKDRGIWRGKRIDNNEWIEGYLIRDKHGSFICNITSYYPVSFKPNIVAVQVDPETLGECTCSPDKNGKAIFEGDIVEYRGVCYKIEYLEHHIRFSANKPGTVFAIFNYTQSEIIGNIHDNPELLTK